MISAWFIKERFLFTAFSCADDSLQGNGFVDDASCGGGKDDQFTFKAFRFSGQTGSQTVVFTVTAKVCYDGSPGCVCNCGARKRRSTLDETSKTLYYIRAGPFTFVDADEGEEQGLYLLLCSMNSLSWFGLWWQTKHQHFI